MSDIALIAPAVIAVTGAALGLVQAYRLRNRARRAALREPEAQGSFRFNVPVKNIAVALGRDWTAGSVPNKIHIRR